MWIPSHQASSQEVGTREVVKGIPTGRAQGGQGSLPAPSQPSPSHPAPNPRSPESTWGARKPESGLDWV